MPKGNKESISGYSSGGKHVGRVPSAPGEKTASWPTKIGKASKNLNTVNWPKVKQSAKTTL